MQESIVEIRSELVQVPLDAGLPGEREMLSSKAFRLGDELFTEAGQEKDIMSSIANGLFGLLACAAGIILGVYEVLTCNSAESRAALLRTRVKSVSSKNRKTFCDAVADSIRNVIQHRDREIETARIEQVKHAQSSFDDVERVANKESRDVDKEARRLEALEKKLVTAEGLLR